MIDIVGIRFKKAGKIYYFDPLEFDMKLDDAVIVETIRGVELGVVSIPKKSINEKELSSPLKPIIRIATIKDIERHKNNLKKEVEAKEICRKKIIEHKLEMKLIDAEFTFDNNKVIFYFTADGRIDFRELVKDLASVFRTRIELRQIGVRDEAKMKGGIGPCGKSLCCNTHLQDFTAVSIKMAKEQNLSLNPTKISGICGRLMCCLKYEQDNYEEIRKRLPKVGSIVDTRDGRGEVVLNNTIRELLKVKINKGGEENMEYYPASECVLVKGEYEDQDNNSEIKLELEDEADKKIVSKLLRNE